MSMAGDVRCTALYFCIDNDIPQDKAIALLNELVEDMDGDPENYNFGEWVASEYFRLRKSRPTKRASDAGDSAAFQAESTAEVLSSPQALSTPTPRR